MAMPPWMSGPMKGTAMKGKKKKGGGMPANFKKAGGGMDRSDKETKAEAKNKKKETAEGE